MPSGFFQPKIEKRNCLFCNNKYIISRIHQKFCSKKCSQIYWRNKQERKNYIPIKCKSCNKLFKQKSKTQFFCSLKCRLKPRKQLEITKPLIREYFLEKANFKCEICNLENNNNLELHHKNPIYKGGKNIVNNIIVLCSQCHLKAHKIA